MEDLKPIEELREIVKKEEHAMQVCNVVDDALGDVKGKIVDKAVANVQDEKIIDKHAKDLTEVAEKGLEVEIEEQKIKVESKHAKNVAERQKIKNELIALRTEAIRLKKEKKQILKEQKAEHKKRNEEMLWTKYETKLTKMKYTYVPNRVILAMLLFFDGIVSFFSGIGAVSTSIMKALKWIIIVGVIIGVICIFPTSRAWLTGLLGY